LLDRSSCCAHEFIAPSLPEISGRHFLLVFHCLLPTAETNTVDGRETNSTAGVDTTSSQFRGRAPIVPVTPGANLTGEGTRAGSPNAPSKSGTWSRQKVYTSVNSKSIKF
jgi:hypothetical protein